MANDREYDLEDLDLDLDLDRDLDLSLDDPEPLPELEEPAEVAAETTDYFTKISPLFSEDPLEEIDLGGEDLPMEEDFTAKDDSQMILDAVEANLRYKRAELNYYESENAMQASDQVNRLYTSLVKSGTNLDKAAISALLRSVINYDNTSIFSDTSKETYEVLIYEILKGIVLRLKDSKNLDEGIAISYITTFDDVKERYFMLKNKQMSIEHMQELAKLVARLNQIITSQEILKSTYFSIKSAITNIQALRKFIVADGTNQSKQSREVAEHISELESDIDMLDMITETIDPEDVDGDVVINQPIGAIFKSIQSPATDEHGNVGFKYVCGHCGQEHFTQRYPFRANHISRSKYEASKAYNYDELDYASAMLLVFNPIQCPSCRAINMFSKNFIMKSKLAAWHLAGSLLISDGRKSYTNVNLIFLSEALQGSLTADDTKLIPPDIKTPKAYEGENPLSNPEVLQNSLDSFVEMVESSGVLQTIHADTDQRNIQYLKFLYKIKPIASLAVDEYSAAYSVLRSNMALFKDLQQTAATLHQLAKERFLLEILDKLVKYLGAPMYTDSIVNPGYIASVLNKYTALVDIDPIPLDGMSIEDVKSVVGSIVQNMSSINQTDSAENEEHIKEILSAYVESYKVGPIGRVAQGDPLMDKSGLLLTVWNSFRHLYPDMLLATVLPIVVSQPTSKFFIGGALKYNQTGELNKSIGEFIKGMKSMYKIHIRVAQDASVEECIKTILTSLLAIEDANVFSGATRVPLQILSKSATPKWDTLDTLENYVLYEFADVFGDSLSYEPFLSCYDLQEALKVRIGEEQQETDSPRSADAINSDLYDSAYLFINCVPTNSQEYVDEKEKLKHYIQAEAEQEAARFRELGI